MVRQSPYIASSGVFAFGAPSGCQIYPVLYIPGVPPVIFGTCDTITYSTHRGKKGVTPCGHVKSTGTTRGRRTIAGTLIFKIFRGIELKQILGEYLPYYNTVLPDELPPFTIVITIPAVNAAGEEVADDPYIIALRGVDIVDSAGSMSIDDVIAEQTFSYRATDMIDMSRATEIQQMNPQYQRSQHDMLNLQYMAMKQSGAFDRSPNARRMREKLQKYMEGVNVPLPRVGGSKTII